MVAIGHGDGNAAELNVDLCNFDAVTEALNRRRPTAIVHLAGIASPAHTKIGDMYAANVVGTANLFAALTSTKLEPRIVIVASSGQLYAPPDAEVLLTENAPLAPKTHYAVSKRAAEEIATIYSRQFPVIVTRPFNYTGPGQTASFLVPKIVKHYAEQRSEIRLGNLDLFRDFSDVGRVIEAYSRLLTRPVAPTTVNICSGRAVHLADILAIMDEISGRPLRRRSDPSLFRAGEARFLVGSPARLESLIGPLPNPEFRDTLARMYDAFVKERGAAG